MKKTYILIPIILIVALILGCTSNVQTVKTGDTVAVDYNLTIDNGTLVDTTVNKIPYTFTVGSATTIKGFSYGVIGMKIYETKTIVIEPKDAYGEHDDSLVETMKLGPNQSYKVGDKVTSVRLGVQGTIIFANSTQATADFNPPLAGKTLTFQVKVVNITQSKDFFNP